MSHETAVEAIRIDVVERRAIAAAKLNTSGITPLDARVLVRPDAPKDKIGGIFLPDSVKDQDKFAQMKGTLVAVGANAWCEAKAGNGFVAPEPGARVLIGKYSGIVVNGDDGVDYRIMNDIDVTGLLGDKT